MFENLIKKINQNVEEVKKMKKYLIFVIAIVAALSFSLKDAMAYPQFASGEINDIYFHNAETWIDVDNTGEISVGDYFYGILHVQNIDGRSAGTVWNEDNVTPTLDTFTGYFLSDVTAVGIHSLQPHITLGTYTGGSDPNSVLSDAEIANGIVLKLWADVSTKWTENTTIAGDIAASTDTSAWATFTADGGYWYTHGPLIPPALPGNTVGETFMGLNLVDNFSGLTFDLVNDVNEGEIDLDVSLAGSGEIEIPQAEYTGQWMFMSNDPVFMDVPEPGTMLLLGSGLIAIGIYARRKAKK